MEIYRSLFWLIICQFGIILTITLFSTSFPGDFGIMHPQFSSMLKSTYSTPDNEFATWLTHLFGALTIVILVVLLYVGLRNKDSKSKIKPILLVGCLFHLVAYLLMLLYDSVWKSDNPWYFGGFPIATALMVYGVALIPLFFTFIYIIRFDDWIFSGEDQDKFQEIIIRRRSRKMID